MRTSKQRRMCSAQRLGWLSSSYGSTLATKLDDAQGKVGRLVKDETVQSGRYCVTTERVVQSSQTVRGIANSKDSVLIQGLVHGQRSVRGYPKVRSELSVMEHQNFIFDMERIRMIGAARELDYFNAHIRLREPGKSEDKVECKTTDSRVMGLAIPWYRRDGTSVESSIPCSYKWRALVVKGAEEVGNTKANSKYQDRAEG
ncbi:hypothetical protein B296_00011268 [Ensete ventricosum]|uniref:Uncharacterized protein n=1 Tax=Ensete ventricosum TaxID=4639 RepID=A0A426Y5F2_ENSVE|nr:hypothetical protein B296_00011268 [Ensete ventricosum]